jgi:hypothetical protein
MLAPENTWHVVHFILYVLLSFVDFNYTLWNAHILNFYIINPLNAELNPICHLLALLGGATIVDVSRLRVKLACKRHDQSGTNCEK